MRLVFMALVVVGFSAPHPASTCSVALDYGSGPDTLQPYDPDRAPPTPEIASAEVRHMGDDGIGCGDTASCTYTGLVIELEQPLATEEIRITYPDGETEYARPRTGEERAEALMPWNSDFDLPAEISISSVDGAGYTSAEVAVTVTEE